MVRRAWAWILSLLLLGSSLLIGPAPAMAQTGAADSYESAAGLLNRYGIVQGDDRGYRFYDQITRAEVAKLLIHSLGLEAQAPYYLGRRDFTDTAGHWAEGHIALARAHNLLQGNPGGGFAPQNPVTYAEAITLLSRLVGLEPSTEAWPRTYLKPARENGILPAGFEVESRLNSAASRGDVFVLLKRTLVDVKNFKGENLLWRYLDKQPPVLVMDPQPGTTADPRLLLSGEIKGAAELTVNGQAIPFKEGFFQHEVSLRMGPNTIRLQATDWAGNQKTETVQVTRIAGEPDSINLSGPARVGVGETARFALTVRDENGEALKDLTRAEVEVSPALGQFSLETGNFTAGITAGTATITVRAGTRQASQTIRVEPGPLDRLVVTPPDIALKNKESTIFQAAGQDRFGNPVPVTGISWTASEGTITSTGLFTAPDKLGTYTITAAAAGKTGTAKVYPPNYQVATVELTRPTGTILANGLTEVTLTATLRDAAGARVTNYEGSLTVTSSAPGTMWPVLSSVPVVDGQAQIRVRAGATAGTAQITVSTNLNKSGSVSIPVEAQRLQSVRLTGIPLPSGPDGWPMAAVEVTALDQEGNPMRSPLSQLVAVELSFSQPNVALFVSNDQPSADVAIAALDASGVVQSRTNVRYSRGAGTLLVTGRPKPTSMSWVQVLPGSINADQVGTINSLRYDPIPEVAAGEEVAIYVNVHDVDGYRVTQPGQLTGASVTLRDQNGVLWPAAVSLQDGLGRARFNVRQVKSGSYTYTATLQPGGRTATATASVAPGEATQVQLSAEPAALKADNASQTVLRAVLLDDHGNRVTARPYSVRFEQLTTNYAVQPIQPQTVATVNGIAELRVTAGRVVGLDSFRATVVGTPWTATTTVTTQGTAQRLRLAYGDNDGDGIENGAQDHVGTAGMPLVIRVEVLDEFGNLLTQDNGRSISLTVRNMTTGQESSLAARTTAGGRATFSLNRSDAATYAIRAESAGLMRALTVSYGGGNADAILRPSHTIALRLQSDIAVLNQDNGTSYTWLTVSLLDNNGNPTKNLTGRPLSIQLDAQRSDTALGYFLVDGKRVNVQTAVIPVGESAAAPVRFYSGSSTGTAEIRATTLDGVSAATSVTTAGLGSLNSLQVQVEGTTVFEPHQFADSALTGQTVTLTAVDASGRRISSYTGPLYIQTNGDARIVAVYNRDLQEWQTADEVVSNAEGNYPALRAVNAQGGQVQVRVRAGSPGIKVYDVGVGSSVATGTHQRTVTGRFEGEWPQGLQVQSEPQTVGGVAYRMVRARLLDSYGGALTAVSGVVTFTLRDSNGGVQASITRSLVSGVATWELPESAFTLGQTYTVETTSDLRRSDGSTVGGSSVTITIAP